MATSKSTMARGDRWWIRELASVYDPISLEPIRTLKYPPFQLRADPEAAREAPDSDYYDGQLLANCKCPPRLAFHLPSH